jgi:hypothetical protein
MLIPRLSTLVLAGALLGGPALAVAAPATVTHSASVNVAAMPAPAATTSAYAAREAKDVDVAKFDGGDRVLVIGTSTVIIVLLVILVVVLI